MKWNWMIFRSSPDVTSLSKSMAPPSGWAAPINVLLRNWLWFTSCLCNTQVATVVITVGLHKKKKKWELPPGGDGVQWEHIDAGRWSRSIKQIKHTETWKKKKLFCSATLHYFAASIGKAPECAEVSVGFFLIVSLICVVTDKLSVLTRS